MVITLGNIKGGVGKSTLACNLAVEAASRGHKTLLIDADTLASSMAFRELRKQDNIAVVAITTATLHKDLEDFKKTFDIIFIDAGGRNNTVFRSAILACDDLIIPTLPSQYDVFALLDTITLLEDARIYKKIPATIVLNQMLYANIGKETMEAMEDIIKKHDVGLAKTLIYARVAFKNSIGRGVGVKELDPHSKAAAEIATLFNELVRLS